MSIQRVEWANPHDKGAKSGRAALLSNLLYGRAPKSTWKEYQKDLLRKLITSITTFQALFVLNLDYEFN